MIVDIEDLHQIRENFNHYFQGKSSYKKILYRKEQFLSLETLSLIEDQSTHIAYYIWVHFNKNKNNNRDQRRYILIFYKMNNGKSQLKKDLKHIQIIQNLNMFSLKHYYAVSNPKKIGFPFLIIEDIPEIPLLTEIHKSMGLSNSRWVNQKINRYLQHRAFFRRRGQKLLRKKEKFHGIVSTESLSYGLNNAVFKIITKYRSRAGITEVRSYVLRVSPVNDNRLKIVNEAKRLKEIQKELVPNPTLYIFEDHLKHLGFRFMIQEMMPGKSVVENLPNFTILESKEFLSNLAHILGSLHSKRSKTYDSYYIDEKTTRKYSFANYIMMELKRTLNNFKELGLDKELDIDTQYLYKWCKGHRPLLDITGFSLIHGDIRPSNILTQSSTITGLIDWEMCCYSDPGQDIGWSLFFFKLYPNLKEYRGHFFSEYWKMGIKFDIEARVYFYEVLAAIKLFTYTRYVEKKDQEKFRANQDFFDRVKTLVPVYIEHITHRD